MTPSIRVFAHILLSVALLLPGLEIRAEITRTYSVIRLKGTVLTRTPTSPAWIQVKNGAVLREGQIIQVTEGATISLEQLSSPGAIGMAGDKIQINISQPMVARLSKDFLREMSLSAFFIDRSNAPLPVDPEVPQDFSLRDAWERLAAIITSIPPPEPPLGNLTQLEEQGMTFGVSAKRIDILTPASNAVIQSKEWPTELKLVWKRPTRSRMKYLVYVWRAEGKRGTAVAMTGQDFYTAKLGRPGTYFVQVTSAEGTWQSVAQPVHALAPLDSVSVTSDSGNVPQRPIADALKARYPFDRLKTTESTGIPFSWQLDTDWQDPVFEIRIFNQSGSLSRVVSTSANDISFDLPPGKYRWNVLLAGTQFKSADNRFEIIAEESINTRNRRRQFLKKVILSGESGVIALQDGF